MMIDAHLHVSNGFVDLRGKTVRAFTESDLLRFMGKYKLDGAVIFSHPEQIYTRPALSGPVKTEEDARSANDLVLKIARRQSNVYPFYFLPLDFYCPRDIHLYTGIKWHSDEYDPMYSYEDKMALARILRMIRQLKFPVILEEREPITHFLIKGNRDISWIIPHCGMCNGGTETVEQYFGMENVYFDISMVGDTALIKHFLDGVGAKRLIFGTDYSGTLDPYYNTPRLQLKALNQTRLTTEEREAILSGNILKLLTKATRY